MRHVLFSAFGFEVFSAPVFAGLAGLAAFLCLRRFRNYMGLTPEDFWNLILTLVLSVPAGAVLFYVLFYNHGPSHNLPTLLAGRLPGGSFWGSLWTAVVCAYLYCRVNKIDFRPVADALGLASMLSLAVMRIGCFLHGCCYGAPTGLPWGVRYYDPRCSAAKAMLGIPLHPSQIYESLGTLAVFSGVYWLFSRRRLKPGGAFVLCIISYSVLRFVTDFYRGADYGILSTGVFTTAQFLAAASAAGSFLWYRYYADK